MTLFLSTIATAQTSSKPIQLSLFHPVQIFDKETSIKGLRINLIYGVNKDVSGIDIGLINKVQGDFLGYQGGIINLIDGNVTGWQDGCVNIVNGQTVGLQTGWLYNFSKEVSGVQFGLINKTESLYGRKGKNRDKDFCGMKNLSTVLKSSNSI